MNELCRYNLIPTFLGHRRVSGFWTNELS